MATQAAEAVKVKRRLFTLEEYERMIEAGVFDEDERLELIRGVVIAKAPIERRLFTLEEYEQMIEAGVFQEDEHLELIRGEILEMAPIGFDHGMGVAKLVRLFSRLLGDDVLLWVQSGIQVVPNSRPEPDLALLKWQDYGASKPATASDVILVVEVADTSVKYDRNMKGPLYAQAGIPEYWIVNLQDGVIEVYTGPAEGVYKQSRKARRGETLALPGGLKGAVQVSDILGGA